VGPVRRHDRQPACERPRRSGRSMTDPPGYVDQGPDDADGPGLAYDGWELLDRPGPSRWRDRPSGEPCPGSWHPAPRQPEWSRRRPCGLECSDGRLRPDPRH
jgi:hypothetical protein